jgi:hypothetical protein
LQHSPPGRVREQQRKQQEDDIEEAREWDQSARLGRVHVEDAEVRGQQQRDRRNDEHPPDNGRSALDWYRSVGKRHITTLMMHDALAAPAGRVRIKLTILTPVTDNRPTG